MNYTPPANYDKKTDSYKLTRTEVRNGTDAQFKYSTQQYDANGNVGFVFQYKLDGGLKAAPGTSRPRTGACWRRRSASTSRTACSSTTS